MSFVEVGGLGLGKIRATPGDSTGQRDYPGSVRRGRSRGDNNSSRTHDELSTPTKVGQMTTPTAADRVAVVTGASAGIGEATARTLAGLGFHVVCVARRADPIKALADDIGGTSIVADVTSEEQVTALADALDRVDVLVNNAGGARGLEPVMEADIDHWRWMWEANVLGTLRVTRALLPKLI